MIGAVYGATGKYTIGFALLAATAAAAAPLTVAVFRPRAATPLVAGHGLSSRTTAP